jgi:hypothetical protein
VGDTTYASGVGTRCQIQLKHEGSRGESIPARAEVMDTVNARIYVTSLILLK